MNNSRVITVNENDEATGTMEKMAAHQAGILHRAFSVFLLNDDNELLLQQRADTKYHSGGLWANTCCSHPFPGEEVNLAATRRLKEEMGIEADLLPAFRFTYKADVGGGLTEHEFDHVFSGSYSGACTPNPDEVKAYKYVGMDELSAWIENEPAAFTTWMRIAFPLYRRYILEKKLS